MNKNYCPNKNTTEFKKMSAVLGDSIATSVWYENKGFPIWLTSTGEASPLWQEILNLPEGLSEQDAMLIKTRMYTKAFKTSSVPLNTFNEPSARNLIKYIDLQAEKNKLLNLYKTYNLLDKNNPNQKIKWTITDANYQKVLKVVQNINKGSVASAKIIKIAADNNEFYSIDLTPKVAFTDVTGEQTAYFDAESGEITFTSKGLTVETVVHEFAHPFVDALYKNNKDLFDNLVADITKDKNIPEINDIFNHIEKNYANSSKEIKQKELLAYTISEYGQGNIDITTGLNTKSAIQKFFDWLSTLAKDIIAQIKSSNTIYVDQIHPKTKYQDVATIFTVFSELGNINLSVSEEIKGEKIDPASLSEAKAEIKRANIKAKIAQRKKGGDSPEIFKAIPTETVNFIDLKDESLHIKKLLPESIDVNLTSGYLKLLEGGNAVVGMFKNSMISLSSYGPKGTAYHEAYHAVHRTLLTEKEQAQVIADIKSNGIIPTAKDIFDIQLQFNIDENEAEVLFYEEQLADAFAEFMLNKINSSLTDKILNFFKQLQAWLKHIFTNTLSVDYLFNSISKRKYAKSIPKLVRGVAYRVHPVFNVHEVNKITKELASIAFKDINDISGLKTSSVTLENIENHILEVYENAEVSGNEQLLDNITDLFNEDGTGIDTFWLKEIDSYLRNVLNLTSKTSNKLTEEDTDEENLEDLERNSFLKSSYEISGKVNATASVKFLVAMTPEIINTNTDNHLDIDKLKTKISELTGLPVLTDFAILYNDLENLLAGTVSIKQESITQDALGLMLNKMRSQAKYKPEMLILANKIENASNQIQTQFFNAFSKQKGNFVHHQIRGNADNKSLRSDLFSANFNTKSAVIFDSWVTNFAKEFGMFKDKVIVYNPEKINEFYNKLQTLLINTDKAVMLVESTGKKLPQTHLNEFKSLLKYMGITINDATLNYLIEQKIAENYELDYNIEYAQKFMEILSDFVRATNELKNRSGNIYGSNNHIQDNSNFFKTVLAESDAFFKKIPGENAFLGPNGNQIYSFQANDMTSKAVSQFQNGDLTYLNLLKNSAYSKNSVWLNEFLDPINGKINRDNFGLYMYGNLKSEEKANDYGDSASDLKDIDAYMDNVNKTLSGYYIGLAEADKTKQTYFKGPKFRKSGLTLDDNGKPIYNNLEGIKILKGYLADEISRMKVANGVVFGSENSKPTSENEWVLYYHYYPVAEGKGTIGEKLDKIPGNAFYSFLFPDLDLKQYGLQSEDGELFTLSPANFDNNTALDSYLKNTFYKLVQQEINFAEELGALEKDKNGAIMPRLISNSIINDPKRGYTQGGYVDVLQIMGDYVLNSMIGNIEQTKLFNGDPANYKVKGVDKIGKVIDSSKPSTADNTYSWKILNLFTDFMKRIPAIFASGQDFRIFNAKDGTPIVRSHYTSATIANIETPSEFFGMRNTETNEVSFNDVNIQEIANVTNSSVEEIKSIFAPYLEINQTDAQAWITLDTYKERLNGLGKWTDAHEDAYNKLVNNEILDFTNLKLFAQPLKTVHSELVPTKNGEMIMHYNKQSEAVLLPFMANLKLGEVMKAMENQGVDHIIVLDGKKSGASGIIDVTDGKNNMLQAKDIKFNYTHLSYNNLFLQQDLPSKGIKDSLVGSQGTKNVLSVVNIDAKYFNDKTGQEVIDLYHETIGRLSDKGLISLDKATGYNVETDKFEEDEKGKSKLHKLVQKEFEGDISENHHNALEENIVFDALPIKTKIMNKLLALTTKKTVKLKQLGGALVQLSDLGFIGTETKLSDPIKNNIIWFKDPTTKLKPMHIEEGKVKPAQILMPHTKMISLLENDKNLLAMLQSKFGVSNFKELSHTQLKSLIDSKSLEGLSYRIPNQSASSNDAFEIVGILPPEMGDTMVAFSDITTKTGCDFDIDKAYIILPNFYFDREAGKIKKIGYDINNIEAARESELQNLRLDLMREMLMHPDAYLEVMSPLDDPWLEKYAKELFPENTKLNPLEFFTGSYQLKTKQVFDNAKALVGVIANHMTHHSLALADNLYFKDYYLGKGVQNDNISIISNKKAEDNTLVSNTLKAFMNAIVDAAKDPFIARANLNMYTASTTFMLTRAGVTREWIVSFIGQPIIVDVVKAQNAQEGRFGKKVWDSTQGKFLSAIETVLKDYGLENVSDKEFRFSDNFKGLREDLSSDITISKEELNGFIANKDLTSDVFKQKQLQVLRQFLEWQNKASELNDLIKVAKADVDGATKNLTTAKLALNLLHKVLDSDKIGNADKMLGIFKSEAGDLEIPKGVGVKMTGRYFNNSVLASLTRFSRFFITGSNASQNLITTVANQAGYTDLVSSSNIEKLVTTISNEIYTLAATKTSAFDISQEKLYTLLYGTGPLEVGKPGELSLAERVEEAKTGDLVDNLLINGLQFKAGRNGAPDKVFLPNTETVKDTKEALAAAWEELLSVDEELGKDLIIYSFYTTGFSNAFGSFAEHIPNSWLKANNFHIDINQKNVEFKDEHALDDSHMDLIFKNLYKDNQLVPVVAKKSIKQVREAKAAGLMVDTNYAFALTQHDSLNYIIGEGPHGKVFKRFVKREIPIFDENNDIVDSRFYLYKLAGYTASNDAIYIRTNTLGVSGFANNIKEYNTDGKTSIFTENNVTLPETLATLVDVLEGRGGTTSTEYENINKPNITDSNSEDRLAFCIMK